MTRSRFLTSSLAAVAVASAITFTAAPADAADTPTGGRATTTVVHPAIPPTYAQELLWSRTTPATVDTTDWVTTPPADDPVLGPWTLVDQRTVIDQQAVPATTRGESRLVTPAYDEVVVDVAEHTVHHPATYTEIQVIDEAAWDEVVVDDPAWDEVVTAPAESAPYAYVDKNGHTKHLSDPDWNGGDDPDHDQGWNRSPALDSTITLHHDATTHVVHHDATYKTATVQVRPAQDEVVRATYETVHHDAVNETVTVEVPGQDALTHPEYRYQLVTPETVVEQWAVSSPGADWVATGETRQGAMTDAGSAEWVEQVPGTSDGDADPVDDPTETATHDPGDRTVAAPVVDPVLPTEEPAAPVKPVRFEQVLGGLGPQAGAPAPRAETSVPQAAPAPHAGVLPNTGNGASFGLTLAGLGSLAGGAVLMLASRRRRFAPR